MPRQRKPQYEYVESLDLYRKRLSDQQGGYHALYGKTTEELEKVIAEYRQLQTLSERGRQNLPVNEYIRQWFEIYKTGLCFGAQTGCRSIIKCNITEQMDGLRMLDVLPKHIDMVMKATEHKSASIYKATYLVLKMVFTSAFENHDIYKNPCPRIHKGGVEPKERVPLTDEQATVLINTIKGTKAYAFCMIGLYAGLRREEILGLQWDCVHFGPTSWLEVKRAHRIVHNRPEVTDKLKSKAAKRSVPLPPQLEECLRELKAHSNSAYVIANNSGGPLSGSQYKALWNAVTCRSVKRRTYTKYVNGKKIVREIEGKKGEKVKGHSFTYEIDFPVTPHILRHTYITNLLLAGVDFKTVQYLAGHEKSNVTMDIYAHLMYHRPKDMIDKINTAFEEENGYGTAKERAV